MGRQPAAVPSFLMRLADQSLFDEIASPGGFPAEGSRPSVPALLGAFGKGFLRDAF